MSKTVLATAVLLAARYVQAQDLCLGICQGAGETRVCTFLFELDIFASETGYYKVEGCEGTQPTLGMEQNVSYIFDQTHPTNWFHPLGFAYGPDGVYRDNVELEKSVPALGGSLECNASTPCQHPQYQLDGAPLCDNDPCDEADFGLDQYEGVWFSGGRDDWLDAGNFTVQVRVTDPATTELFYFCHIHNHMSGRIKVIDPVTQLPLDPVDYTPIPYEYHTISDYDAECGTFNASQYEDLADKCPEMDFHCNQEANTFAKCMAAINCKMHVEMRTSMETDPTAQFMYQMIAHHQNAVNMAKIMLKLNPGSLKCGTSYDGRRRQLDNDPFCNDNNDGGGTPAVTLLWDIVNTQNQQITFMRAWLADNLQASHDYCHAEDSTETLIIVLAATLAVLVVGAMAGVYFFKFRRPATPNNAKLVVDEA